ncbi:MAG: glutamate--tRNA ligase [Candidatus Curtissbacteria bacterium]|nr:glutamate--tRNA ligase [Candidatus Curtissbacteria bacterium]
MSEVRVRYAPSPTGIPHIGNIRTALYNYLFAKASGGKFILRIEDTDRKRLVEGSEEKIEESLKVLGLIWDEQYRQSERVDTYKKYLEELKKKDVAYEDEGAWRVRVPEDGILSWEDVVHGKVEFASKVLEDFIIIKSDGFPTYHFASVIDDHEMKISHVIRGDEWISSTPKHLLLYESLGWKPPNFVHVPPILGNDHKKLSKREGAKSVLEYVEEGYLPEALVNFLVLLGWSPKDNKEIFSLEDLTKIFSLERLNKNSPIFNVEKLNWLNGQWIRKLSDKELLAKILKTFPGYDAEVTKKLIPITKDRINKISEFKLLVDFLFEPPKEPLPVSIATEFLEDAVVKFEKLEEWKAQSIKGAIDETAREEGVDRIELIKAIRNIVSGREVTPPLYESLEILGKDETVKRLQKFTQKK